MQKKNYLLVSILFLFMGGNIFAQGNNESFKPSGKADVKIFTNFHSSFVDGVNHNAFEIQRAYFGYSFDLSENVSGKVTLDVGSPGVGKLDMTAYLKNAYFQYKQGNFTTQFGLISMQQFKLSEKQWGGRYLYKSFQDQHKLGSSADLAWFAKYKVNDMISADVTVSNGEGYKSLESDSILKYSAGVTINPVKGLTVRGYYDYMGEDDAQQTISGFVGYTHQNLKLGAEYNKQMNHKMTAEEDLDGFSVFGSYKVKHTRFFARYDRLMSVELDGATDPWNFAKDGDAIIFGAEFNVAKGLKITPNYQGWMPADGSPVINIAYLSCEIKF